MPECATAATGWPAWEAHRGRQSAILSGRLVSYWCLERLVFLSFFCGRCLGHLFCLAGAIWCHWCRVRICWHLAVERASRVAVGVLVQPLVVFTRSATKRLLVVLLKVRLFPLGSSFERKIGSLSGIHCVEPPLAPANGYQNGNVSTLIMYIRNVSISEWKCIIMLSLASQLARVCVSGDGGY